MKIYSAAVGALLLGTGLVMSGVTAAGNIDDASATSYYAGPHRIYVQQERGYNQHDYEQEREMRRQRAMDWRERQRNERHDADRGEVRRSDQARQRNDGEDHGHRANHANDNRSEQLRRDDNRR